MEKATKIISKIVAIAMIVLGAIGVVGTVLSVIRGIDFGAIIIPVILTVAELVIGIMLLGALNDLASTKYFVMIIVATVLLLLDVILGGAAGMTGLGFAVLGINLLALCSIVGIIVLVAAIAALVLKIVMVCKK